MAKKRKHSHGTQKAQTDPSSQLLAPHFNKITREVTLEWNAPLPPPAVIKQYDEFIPGAGNRIMSAFENEIAHRQGMQNKLLGRDTALEWGGLVAAFLVFLAFLVATVVLLLNGKTWEGSAFGGVNLLMLLHLFRSGNQAKQRFRQKPEKTS